MTTLALPCTTATARDILGLAKDKILNELVRSGRLRPAPPVVSGRRLWSTVHLLEAARVLDRLTPELEGLLRRAERREP